ncbi:MAG: hypothetical protein L3J44_01980, partial [Campylobacteraceae bacterium]|nr:hypothetical protein [Campylobacteraceae bacterium]
MRKLSILAIIALSINLQAVTMNELFDAIKKQPTTKIDEISLGEFKLKKVNAAFPDSTSIAFARKFKERNGSIGGGILKRFNIIFDYPNRRITLKKNHHFSNPFYYNMSGIVLEHSGVRVVKKIDRSIEITTFNNKNKSITRTP